MSCCAESGQEIWGLLFLQVVRWIKNRLCAMMSYMAAWRGGETTGQEQASREEASRQAARLLDQYGNRILRLAYTYLHNMSDAEDILQDTLLQFLKKSPSFDSAEHEKAWLLRVAANLSKNRIAYNAVRRTDELDETLAAEEREDLSFVWEAVKSLPAQYREAIHLFYYEGYSTRQIAEILNKKEAAVRSDLHRGRAKLKVLLKGAYDFEERV